MCEAASERHAVTILGIAALLGCVACGGPGDQGAEKQHEASQGHVVHWGYNSSDGPDRWAELNSEWAICADGRSQSPIDIRDAATSKLDDMVLRFEPATLKIIHQEHVVDVLNNGHTVQINYTQGDTLTVAGTDYDLLQGHFHSPSEHTVDGKHFPMEMHLVHKAAGGDLAVIGVFIEEGEHNPVFDTVWSNLPTRKGVEVHLEHVTVDIDELLPRSRRTYRYDGSLTTPPCSEQVRWFVFQEPIPLSAAQIDEFKALFGGNNRPTQPLNERRIVTDVTRDG